MIISDRSVPSPASVVKALAPILAPVFAGMTGKSKQTPKLKGTGKSDSDSGFEVENNLTSLVAHELPQIAQVKLFIKKLY